MTQLYDDMQVEVLISEHAALKERLDNIQKEQAELREKLKIQVLALEHEQAYHEAEIAVLKQRIEKVREILERDVMSYIGGPIAQVRHALEALDGK